MFPQNAENSSAFKKMDSGFYNLRVFVTNRYLFFEKVFLPFYKFMTVI